MTRYTPLLVSLAVVPLMGQSDCEPTDTEDITVVFVDRTTGAPMANIPVWLGVDGLGPVSFTDEAGEAHFQMEGTTHTISYGYYVNSIKSDAIYTYLNHDFSETVTFQVTDQSTDPLEMKTLRGEISGIDPEGGDNLDIDLGSDALYLDVTESTTQAYEKAIPESSNVPFIYAAQHDGAFFFGLPTAFQMILNPEDETSISLDRTLDAEVTYTPKGVMDNPGTVTHAFYLSYGGESAYGIRDEVPIGDAQAFTGPIPTLDNGLEEVTMDIVVSVEGLDDRYQQSVQLPNPTPGVQPVNFKGVHSLVAPGGASVADLEGMSLHIDNTQGDYNSFFIWEWLEKGDDHHYGGHYWKVIERDGVSSTITMPIIPPETGLRWASITEDDPTVESWSVWAYSSVVERGEKEDHFLGSRYSDFEFMAPSTQRQMKVAPSDAHKALLTRELGGRLGLEPLDPAGAAPLWMGAL